MLCLLCLPRHLPAAGRMRQGTVLEVLDDGRRLLVAVSNDAAQTSAGGVTRPPTPEQCRCGPRLYTEAYRGTSLVLVYWLGLVA